jgi:hypothetical protein
LNERLWKKTFQTNPPPKFVEFQRWSAAGADSETEIGLATKTGATQRNEGRKNTRAQKIERHAATQLELSGNFGERKAKIRSGYNWQAAGLSK